MTDFDFSTYTNPARRYGRYLGWLFDTVDLDTALAISSAITLLEYRSGRYDTEQTNRLGYARTRTLPWISRMNTDNPDYPLIDYGHDGDQDEPREILSELTKVEPYVAEIDWWCRLPVRVTHSCLATGFCIELGPYAFDETNISRFCGRLLARYDIANHGSTIWRVK